MTLVWKPKWKRRPKVSPIPVSRDLEVLNFNVVAQDHLRSRCLMARTVLERTHLFQTGTHLGVVRMLRDYLAQDVDCG